MLSVAVHKDIAEYQPKIVGKMTMRTLVSITGALSVSVLAFDFERYLKNGCEPYTPDEDMGAEFTAWKWAAWKKSRKGLLGKLLNR